jgi:hypothetical protein
MWHDLRVGRPKHPAAILFLMAAVVRERFADPAERRWRLTEAYLLLAGRKKATQRDLRLIDEELAK